MRDNSLYWMTSLFLLVGSSRRAVVAFSPSSSLVRRTLTTTRQSMTKISISDTFDGGNGQLVQILEDDETTKTVHVEIKKDP